MNIKYIIFVFKEQWNTNAFNLFGNVNAKFAFYLNDRNIELITKTIIIISISSGTNVQNIFITLNKFYSLWIFGNKLSYVYLFSTRVNIFKFVSLFNYENNESPFIEWECATFKKWLSKHWIAYFIVFVLGVLGY